MLQKHMQICFSGFIFILSFIALSRAEELASKTVFTEMRVYDVESGTKITKEYFATLIPVKRIGILADSGQEARISWGRNVYYPVSYSISDTSKIFPCFDSATLLATIFQVIPYVNVESNEISASGYFTSTAFEGYDRSDALRPMAIIGTENLNIVQSFTPAKSTVIAEYGKNTVLLESSVLYENNVRNMNKKNDIRENVFCTLRVLERKNGPDGLCEKEILTLSRKSICGSESQIRNIQERRIPDKWGEVSFKGVDVLMPESEMNMESGIVWNLLVLKEENDWIEVQTSLTEICELGLSEYDVISLISGVVSQKMKMMPETGEFRLESAFTVKNGEKTLIGRITNKAFGTDVERLVYFTATKIKEGQ